jgi:flagella basal body P-ring formation protein FlgA
MMYSPSVAALITVCLPFVTPTAHGRPVQRDAEQTVSADVVCDNARRLVGDAASARELNVRLTCARVTPLRLPMGPVTWELLGSPPPLASGASRLALRVSVAGRSSLTGLPVTLTVSSDAWVVQRDFAEGEVLRPNDVRRSAVEWPVGVAPVPATPAPPVGRLRRALRAGDPVLPASLLPGDERLQGDVVTVEMRTHTVTLEVPAVLMADARVGQPARAQLKGRRVTVEGRLVDAGTLVVTP